MAGPQSRASQCPDNSNVGALTIVLSRTRPARDRTPSSRGLSPYAASDGIKPKTESR